MDLKLALFVQTAIISKKENEILFLKLSNLYQRIHTLFSVGRVVQCSLQKAELLICPVCDKHVATFLPLPAFYEENLKKHGANISFDDAETLNWRQYSCPECSASDRDRLCALYLKQKLSVARNYRCSIVDFAPSKPLSEFIRKLPLVDYRTADIEMKDVDDFIDIMDMKIYPDNNFDIFICSHVLEHVKEDRKALRELYRILKPGGWGIILAPLLLSVREIDEDISDIGEAERWRRFGQFDHVRRYSKQGFLSRVSDAGFNVNQLGIGHFGKETFRMAAITDKSVLYVVTKIEL